MSKKLRNEFLKTHFEEKLIPHYLKIIEEGDYSKIKLSSTKTLSGICFCSMFDFYINIYECMPFNIYSEDGVKIPPPYSAFKDRDKESEQLEWAEALIKLRLKWMQDFVSGKIFLDIENRDIVQRKRRQLW